MNKSNANYGSCLCHIKSVQPEAIVLTCFALQMVLKSAVHKHRLAIVTDEITFNTDNADMASYVCRPHSDSRQFSWSNEESDIR